jgi:hypothetical protein
MRNAAAIAFAVAVLSSCKYAQVMPAGTAVQPVTEPPAADCKNLGVVTGKGGGGLGQVVPNERLIEFATNDALNKAGERGATHLVLMAPTLGSVDKGTTTTATVTGVAYQCPGAAGATAAVPAAAPAAAADVAATVKAVAQARSAPDKSAPARFELAAGTRVMASPTASRGFRKVRTEDGRAGYVEDALLQVAAP